MSTNGHPERLSRIGDWSHELLHEAVIAHIRGAGLEEAVVRDMRALGNPNVHDFFRDDNGANRSRKKRWVGKAEVATFARLCQVLAAHKRPLPLRELLLGAIPYAMTPDERLQRVEAQLKSAQALEAVVTRTLRSVLDTAAERFEKAVHHEADAILRGEIARHTGYITGEEMRQIGEVSSHVRVMTTRLDLGASWNRDGTPIPRGNFFAITRDRLRDVRHTFIVPDGTTVINPDPFSNRAITWQDRVVALTKLYQQHGQIPPAHWAKMIVFRQTPLPIPASAALFELSGQGFERLSARNPDLVASLQGEQQLFLQMPGTRRTFIGMGFSGAAVPHLTTLMNASNILFASNAFIGYWQALSAEQRKVKTGSDPLEGLPTSPSTEYPAWPPERRLAQA